jgi:hypothetical protein
MFALGAVICFILAFILDIAGVSHGHFDPGTFTIAGLVFLALWALAPGWPASWSRTR